MQRVLSDGLWRHVKTRARNAQTRKAAIAYVTQDLLGFREGDLLVVDASSSTVAAGGTNARLLRKLMSRGVEIHHCASLHAKVALAGELAVIGSANMSRSTSSLVEAGLLTDHGSTVSAVASFIEQLAHACPKLTARRIAELCKIKVVGRGMPGLKGGKRRQLKIQPLGNRTWLVGVRELSLDPPPRERELIDRTLATLEKEFGVAEDDLSWINWGLRGRFARECRPGDTLIEIWRSKRSKRPSSVERLPVLLRQRTKRWTRFYLGEPLDSGRDLGWGEFQRLIKRLGHARRVGPHSMQVMVPEMADAIARSWKSARGR